MKSNIRKTFIAKSLVFASLISSLPVAAFSYEDDATAARTVPVVRALPTGFASPENELTITATFDDLINRQFDLRMEVMADKIRESILNSITPVGYILTLKTPSNPSSLGYVGSWAPIQSDLVLVSTNSRSELGRISGDNKKIVPLPAHSHRLTLHNTTLNKTFYTDYDGTHSHSGVTNKSGDHTHDIMRPYGDKWWTSDTSKNSWWGDKIIHKERTTPSGEHSHTFVTSTTGSHRHRIAVNFGGHTHSGVAETSGVSNPTIDVMGRHMKVYMWERIS